MRTRAPVVATLLALSAAPLFGCDKSSGGGGAQPAASSTPSAPAPASPSVPASAKPAPSASAAAFAQGPCRLDGPAVVVDKTSRPETGVTLVRLPDDRYAIGYAAPDGTPRAAVVSLDGTASVVDVALDKLPAMGERLPAKTRRYVQRVTPIEAKAGKVRVAVDFADIRPDGSRAVRCGAADEDPLVAFAGGGGDAGVAGFALRECRSFTSKGALWALASEVGPPPDGEARWRVVAAGAKPDDARAVIERVAIPKESGRATPSDGQLDRYGFTALSSVSLEDAGTLVASRSNGKLHLSKRGPDGDAVGSVTDFWLGAAVGPSALLERDRKVVVLFPMSGKAEMDGLTFPVEGKPPKPAPIPLFDPAVVAQPMPLVLDPEWTSVTGALTSTGEVVVAFVERRGGRGRARFATLDGALTPRGAPFDPLGESGVDVSDIKLAALADDRILVATSVLHHGEGVAIEAAMLRCGAPTDAH